MVLGHFSNPRISFSTLIIKMVDPEIIRRCTGWPYDRVQNIDERYVSRPDRTLADWCKDLVISGGNEIMSCQSLQPGRHLLQFGFVLLLITH